MTDDLFDMIEGAVYVRADGAIVWESILEKRVSPAPLKRILDLVADHIGEAGAIDWAEVRREFLADSAPARP